MAMRLIVTLDARHAAKLSRLANRARTQEETLATSLISRALDEAEPDATVAHLLDGIPDGFERALLGRDQGRTAKTTRLEDL